jgi:hypothetical protein
LKSLTNTLWSLADAGLGAASILANLHHRRITPLMERELRIFEMSDVANPTSLARSRLLQDRLLPEYTATRARRAVSLKSVPHSHDNLWSFVVLPDAPAVSGLLPRFKFSRRTDVGTDSFRKQRVTVQATRSDPPTPRARSVARAAQQREQERAAWAKERRLRRREHREQYSEEYWLREQQGLSPPGTPAGSSSEEEEDSDGGRSPREVKSPVPVTTGCGGGCGVGACGWRGGTRHRVISGGARSTEEEEAGLLQLEVSSTSHVRP